MSRCVPFPPPGYWKNGLSGDALIDLIKLKRIKHEEKVEKRKGRKRERKHRNGENSGGRLAGFGGAEKLMNDGENGENSDVTAKHEQATIPRSVSCCFNETRSGRSEREREVLCHDDDGNKGIMIRFRIKLPMKKQVGCEIGTVDGPCATSGANTCAEQIKSEVQVQLSSRDGHGLETCGTSKDSNTTVSAEQSPTSGRDGINVPDETAKPGRSAVRKAQSSKSPFEVLMDNFTMHHFQSILPADEGNEDWLFGSSEQHGTHQSKRLKMTHDETANAPPTVWSHAHCLPEPGTFALPYTVIF